MVERKFLVISSPKREDALHSSPERLLQGYLHETRPVTQIRIVNKAAFLLLKGKGLLFQYEIHIQDALDLFPLCKKALVRVRNTFDTEGVLWLVDEFPNGLRLATVEAPPEDGVLTFPNWVGEEVTEDFMYTDVNLARWSAQEALEYWNILNPHV